LPSTLLVRVEIDDDASDFANGLHVDFYGDECGERFSLTNADT